MTLLLCALFSYSAINATGFLHADGKKVVDINGEEIILRGHAPGGWVLMEPYMMETGDFTNSQHEIKAKIESVLGKENTEEFYKRWHANGFTENDVKMLADFGFNSIRLPLHYNLFTLPIEDEPVKGENTWLDYGFNIVDNVLSWCEKYQIYLILDMHATPGGQGKDSAISDYDPSKKSLWESTDNQDKLVALWVKLAERYADKQYIGGYDLINEPNWAFDGDNQNGCNENKNTQIWNLYKRLVDAIREVDQNHMMIFEGNCWCNNFNGLPNINDWDNNLCLEFHKYWTINDAGSIQFITNLRNTKNVPVWCGESGENSNHWYADAVQLFEENGIGWSWWTWKKIGSVTGIGTIHAPAGYETLKNYWNKGGTKPTQEFATKVMFDLADAALLENVTINKAVVDALLRQPHSDELMPYADNKIPGNIYAADFDLGRNGIAYNDIDGYQTTHTSGGDYVSWNQGWSYRADGVDVEACSDANSNGYSVGWTTAGEWMKYTIDVDQTAAYKLTIRYASSNASTTMAFEVDGAAICADVKMASTGGWQTWKSVEVPNVVLSKGKHVLKVTTVAGGANLNYYAFTDPQDLSTVEFKAISATTTEDGSAILLSLNMDVDAASLKASDFTIKCDSKEVSIDDIQLSDESAKNIVISLSNKLYFDNVVTLSCTSSAVKNIAGIDLDALTNLKVTNVAVKRTMLPGTIKVENYYAQSGLSFETCEDKVGGCKENFGYTDPGDYIDFIVNIPEAGTYSLEYRIAAQAGNGKFEIQLFDDENNKTSVGSFKVDATGGWQTWKSMTGSVELPEGTYKMRIYIVSKEFNMNWFSLSKATPTKDLKVVKMFTTFPNPCHEVLNVSLTSEANNGDLSIYDMSGKVVYSQKINGEATSIDLSSFKAGMYIVSVQTKSAKYAKQISIEK